MHSLQFLCVHFVFFLEYVNVCVDARMRHVLYVFLNVSLCFLCVCVCAPPILSLSAGLAVTQLPLITDQAD